MKEDYDNASFFLKWYQLPYCRKGIKEKIKYSLPSSPILALAYTMYHMSKSDLKVFPMQTYLRSCGCFLVGSAALIFLETLLTDPYW